MTMGSAVFGPATIYSVPTRGKTMCNDPYRIIQDFNKFDQVWPSLTKFDQPIVGGPKLTFSRMNNFELTMTPLRRPRR